MFGFFNTQQRIKRRKTTRKQTRKYGDQFLKNIVLIMDDVAFQQNLDELYEYTGIKQLDPHSQTYQDLRTYLIEVLQYPSRSLAKLHRQSYRLGKFDNSSQQQTVQTFDIQHLAVTEIDKLENCPCCGLRKQTQQLKICSTQFKDLQIVGISTYMFFRTLRNLLYFLILALIVFGAFAFGSNIKCSNLWNNSNILKSQFFRNTILISLGSKIYLALNQGYNDLLIWQVWLGLAMIVLFIVGYVLMEKVQVASESEIDRKIKSVGDYSIVIKGIPAGVTKEQLQKALDSFFQQKNPQISHKIVKINCGTPINISSQIQQNSKQQFNELEQQKLKYKEQIFSWIYQLRQNPQFITPRPQRQRIVEQFQKTVDQLTNKQEQIVSQVEKLYQQNKVDTLTDCYVTFQSKRAKQHLLQSLSSNAFEKFLHYLTFNIYKKTIKLNIDSQSNKQQISVKIQQASQPQDIIWENIGMRTIDLIVRKSITFFFTFVVLGMSFAVVYGLSTVQVRNQDNRYISFLISLTIVIFNYLINIFLAIFTAYELNSTHTDYQCSYAVKSIFAQLVNTILIPILVNRFLKKQNYIYTTSGLAEDIFLLGLTISFVKPLLTMFDPYYFFVKHLNVWYFSKPKNRTLLNQIQFNKIYELMLFQSGTEYIYIISLYLWTCFFMSLQPVIIAFSILGLIMNYWAVKYSLFHRCKRPVPGTKILYDTMVQFVYAGGLVYSLGSLSFTNLIPDDLFDNKLNFALIANLIAIGISAISLFIPFSYLYAIFFYTKEQEKDELYEQNRIFFPSEYDRMNPATSKNAIDDFLKFVNEKKNDIKRLRDFNESELKRILRILQNQSKSIYVRSPNDYNPMSNFKPIQNKLTQLLKPKIQILHPLSIQNYLVTNLQNLFMNNAQNQNNNQINQQNRRDVPSTNQIESELRLKLQNQDEGKGKKVTFTNEDKQSLPLKMNYFISPYNPPALKKFIKQTNQTRNFKFTSSRISP